VNAFACQLLLLLVPLAVLTMACTSYEPPRQQSALSQREVGLRQDCNAMMGTAFRAAEERSWFEANCSKWPAVSAAVVPAAPVGQPQPSQPGVVQGDTPECAAMRGRPYGNEQERQWFLANCIRQEAPRPAAPAAPAAAQPAVQQSAAPQNPNAAVCETLRRTPNPTDAQRRWYFTYCDQR